LQENKKPGVGVGVMILREGKVLLGKRHSDPKKASSALHGEGTWTMPGGKLDFGEELEACACRETFEETGIIIQPGNLKIISVSNDIVYDNHFVTIEFLCEKSSGDSKVMEPEEITEWQWFELDKLPEPLYLPSKKVLDNNKTDKIKSCVKIINNK
jgi:8-oxo-dGTP diphosphatase